MGMACGTRHNKECMRPALDPWQWHKFSDVEPGNAKPHPETVARKATVQDLDPGAVMQGTPLGRKALEGEKSEVQVLSAAVAAQSEALTAAMKVMEARNEKLTEQLQGDMWGESARAHSYYST